MGSFLIIKLLNKKNIYYYSYYYHYSIAYHVLICNILKTTILETCFTKSSNIALKIEFSKYSF